MKLTPNQVVDALRKCTSTDECYGCPYTDEQGFPLDHCMRQAMEDAAEIIELLQGERTIDALRDFVKGGLR